MGSRTSAGTLNPLPPDPARHQLSAIPPPGRVDPSDTIGVAPANDRSWPAVVTAQLAVDPRQVGQHRVGIGDLQPDTRRLIAKAWLDEELLDQPIFHVH